jgi:hypothetical protein
LREKKKTNKRKQHQATACTARGTQSTASKAQHQKHSIKSTASKAQHQKHDNARLKYNSGTSLDDLTISMSFCVVSIPDFLISFSYLSSFSRVRTPKEQNVSDV